MFFRAGPSGPIELPPVDLVREGRGELVGSLLSFVESAGPDEAEDFARQSFKPRQVGVGGVGGGGLSQKASTLSGGSLVELETALLILLGASAGAGAVSSDACHRTTLLRRAPIFNR
jgi:hypothetical protein